MGRTFEVARMYDGWGPTHVDLETAATFKYGALVVDADLDGLFDECAADPATVFGVALEGAFTHPGNAQANASQVVFTTGGSLNKCAVAKAADAGLVFSCRGKNGATDPVTPLTTHIGEEYGVVKVGDDWVMDFTETSAKVVHIVGIDVDNKIFFVKFISTVAVGP